MPRGKKICPECNAAVGPRLAVCECGYAFTFKTGKAPKAQRVRTAELAVPGEKPAELTVNPSEVVGLSDPGTLDSFIKQIKACREDSARNGGCYSCFLHHKQGILQIEIQLKVAR